MAARDIKPWEAVLQDEALVVAPGDHPLCVLCLGNLGEGGVPSFCSDGNFTKQSAGLSGVSKCPGCGWPICPTCYELTSGPKGRKNEKCKFEPAENEDIAGTHWGQKCHKTECLLFQERGVRPSLEDTGQRHWLYPALGVIR